MSATRQALWGAVGGVLPTAIKLIQLGTADIGRDLPVHIGTFFVTAVVLSMALGAIAGRAFKSHDMLVALYHGASAPITLAFVIGLGGVHLT